MRWSQERSVFTSAYDGLLKFSTILLPLVVGKIPGFISGINQADTPMLMSLTVSSFGLLYYYGKLYEDRAKNKSRFLMLECLLASVCLLISMALCVMLIASQSKLSDVMIAAAVLLYVLSIMPVLIEIFITFKVKDKVKEKPIEQRELQTSERK